MPPYKPTREDALELLKKYNTKDSLIRHALSVESVMGHFADKFNEDREQWEIIGLVHDLDYNETNDDPERHAVNEKSIEHADQRQHHAADDHQRYGHRRELGLGEPRAGQRAPGLVFVPTRGATL